MAAPTPTPAERRLGYKTAPNINPVTSTVQTTPTQILTNNPRRIFVLVVNLSINRGWIGWSTDVSSSKGVPIAASGGFVSLQIDEDAELCIYPMWALLENAAGTFYVLEIEED
jgi:hypothetical protein